MHQVKQADTAEAANQQKLFVPHPSRWFEFAHGLNGYQIADALGIDLAELSDRSSASFHSEGQWPGSLLELRLLLFFRARAVRFVGGLEDDPEFEAEIGSLLNAIALAVDQCHSTAGQEPKAEYLPQELELGIGGHWPPSYSVEWRDGRLIYEGRERVENSFNRTEVRFQRFVRPTVRRWHGFWKSLDEISAWEWRAEYVSPAMDGTGWHVSVSRGAKSIRSHGSNAYPPDDWQVTPEFRTYLSAVRRLLGGLPFS